MLFQSLQQNDLSLTTENAQFLFSAFERKPDLNVAEVRMLCRATRCDEETIEFFCELEPFLCWMVEVGVGVGVGFRCGSEYDLLTKT